MKVSLTQIKAQETRFEKLHNRMDNDLKLWYLEKFVFKDSHNNPIANADSITLNDTRTFAEKVISYLGTATRRFNCTGAEPEDQRAIEDFYKKVFLFNDEHLSEGIIEPFDFCQDWFSVNRGWVAARVLMIHQGDKWLPELIPIDPRQLTWKLGKNGIAWGEYKYLRDKDELVGLYGSSVVSPYDTRDPNGIVFRETWTDTHWDSYVGDTLIDSVEHKLAHCPIVVVPVPTQPLLVGSEDALSRQGESVYSTVREIYSKLNELASTWATMNKMSFMAPIAFTSPQNRKLTEKPYGIGVVVNLKDNEKFVEIPTKEMSASAQNLFGQLLARWQRGTLPNVDYGELGFELSAVAIAKLTEGRDQVFVPRLRAKAILYKKICRLIKLQYKTGGYKASIDEDEACYFEDSLKEVISKKWQIQIDFHAMSPEQNIANYTVAQAGLNIGLSRRAVMRDILKREDWKEDEAQTELENAKKENAPYRHYLYCVEALAERDKHEKDSRGYKILDTSIKLFMWQIKQMTQGAVEPPEFPHRPASQPSGAGVQMPKLAAQHINEENTKRQGMQVATKGRQAQSAQPAEAK